MATDHWGRSPGPTDDSEAAQEPTPRSAEDAALDRIITILVIDDDPGIRESTADILRGDGFGVIEADDGVEGLERLHAQSVDVVLLDLQMPQLGGAVVLASLDDPPPVVVVSDFETFDETDVARTFGPKVYACLRKPVQPERLLSVVKEATQSGKARDWTY